MPQNALLGSLGDPLRIVPGPAQFKVRTPTAILHASITWPLARQEPRMRGLRIGGLRIDAC
eukprot:4686519-Alexandrium_andersonii.AAC.1